MEFSTEKRSYTFDFNPVQHYYLFFVGPLFQGYRRRGTLLRVAYLRKASARYHRTYRYLRFEPVMLSANNSLLLDLSAQNCEYLDGNLNIEDVFTEIPLPWYNFESPPQTISTTWHPLPVYL